MIAKDQNCSYLQYIIPQLYSEDTQKICLYFIFSINIAIIVFLFLQSLVILANNGANNQYSKILSFFFQIYYHVLLLPSVFLSFALLQRESIIATLNIIISLAIVSIQCLHNYDYRYIIKDYLSQNNRSLMALIIALEVTYVGLCSLFDYQGQAIISFFYYFTLLGIDIVYNLHLDKQIQIINIFGITFNFMFSTNQFLTLNIQNWKIFNLIIPALLPLSYKISKTIHYSKFYASLNKLDYDDYLQKKSSLILEEITSAHQLNCYNPNYCFCILEKDIHEKQTRSQYLLDYIEKYYEHELHTCKDINILHLSYLSFLLDAKENINKCQVKAILLINSFQKQHIILSQVLQNFLQQSKQKQMKQAEGFKFLSKGKDENLHFYEVMEFDQSMVNIYKETKNCLIQKKNVIQILGKDTIELEKIYNQLLFVRNQREQLSQKLEQLVRLKIKNSQLSYLIQVFQLSLSFDRQLGNLEKNLHRKWYLSKRNSQFDAYFNSDYCSVFVSLTNKLGQIKQVSTNFEKIVPVLNNKEIIGKNISVMQHSLISEVHDKMLIKYLNKSVNQLTQSNFDLILGIDSQGFAVAYKLKAQTYLKGDQDFGICALIRQIPNSDQYILLIQNQNFEYKKNKIKYKENQLLQSLLSNYSKKYKESRKQDSFADNDYDTKTFTIQYQEYSQRLDQEKYLPTTETNFQNSPKAQIKYNTSTANNLQEDYIQEEDTKEISQILSPISTSRDGIDQRLIKYNNELENNQLRQMKSSQQQSDTNSQRFSINNYRGFKKHSLIISNDKAFSAFYQQQQSQLQGSNQNIQEIQEESQNKKSLIKSNSSLELDMSEAIKNTEVQKTGSIASQNSNNSSIMRWIRRYFRLFYRYEQKELNSYIFEALEGEACTLMSQNLDLITNSSSFSLDTCLEIKNGIVNSGIVKELYLNKFNTQITEQTQQNKLYLVDFYLRSVYNSVELDFDKYLCADSSVFLEYISLQHQMYCQKPQFCFCSTKVDEKDKLIRSELVYEYIERYFEVELKNIQTLSFLHVSYLAFLLDVQQNFNKFFVKANQIMSKCENQILYQKSIKLLIQIAILYQKGALFQSNSQTPQNIQFIEILEFDDNINQCLLKSKQFIDQKKQTLLDIGQDYFDLKKVNFDLLKLFQFRQEIYISLQDLIKKQIQSHQLHFLIDIYENYLSPETQLSQLLIRINKKNILDQKYKNIQIDGKKCYAFISLSENIGQVIKVSNNFDQIVPNTSNTDVIGKNINFMQPSSIAKAHDAILKNYLTKFKSKNSSMHLNPIIGIDKDNWAIPYQIKLQTCQIDNYNYGVCAQINLIEDCNQYILIDQAKHYEIVTVSQTFYKQILEQSIGQTKQKNINFENFTTIMIKPQDKNQLDWMKNPNFDDLSDSNFLELDIYAIKGEMSTIENQFVHLIQLKIFEIIQILEIHDKIEQLQNVFQILKKSSIQKSSFQNIAMSLEQIQPQQSKQFQSENMFRSFKNINSRTLTDQFVRQIQEQSESSDELPLEKQQNQRIEAQITLDSKSQALSPLNRFKVTQGEDYLNENNLELTRVTQILSPQNSFVALNSKQLFQLNSTEREMSITSRNQIEQLSLLNKKRLSKQKSNFQNEFNTFNSLKQKSLTLNYYIENHKQKNKNKKQQEQDQNNLINQFSKKQEVKTIKQHFQVAGSLQSFNSHSSSRKNILTNIKQTDKFIGLLLVRVLGVLGLVTFLVVTLIYFLTLNKQLQDQKNDYSNITWSSHLQSPIAEIITDNVFNRTFFLPFFGISLKQYIQLNEDLDYQLHYNYNTTKDSIWNYMKSDKSTTQLYNIVLNENIDYTFLYSLTRYDIHSVNFGYALEMIYALSYDVVNGLDITTQNLVQIGLNLVSISQALTRFKAQAGDEVNQTFDTNQNLITIQFIAIMLASLIFALSFPLIYYYIQLKRQKILSLFATISPQSIVCMLVNIADCQHLLEKNTIKLDQKKKLSAKNLNNQTEQKSVQQFNNSLLVQKRKNISITNHIPYFSFKVAVLSLFFFTLAQIGSVTNFILVNNFIEEEKANREFIGDLMDVYEFCITTSTLRVPMIIYKIQDNLSQTYIDLINQEVQKVDEILKTVYGLVDKVYNDKRYEQQSFKNFVMQALQDNSCLVIQQNLNLLNNPKFQLEQCNQIANGIFQKGLIQVVKLHADLYAQRSSELLNSDMLSFFQLLNQQQQDLSEIDHFYLRIYLEYTIQCIETKVAQITYDHYNYMIKMNYIIFAVSIIAFLILIYISFFKFFEYSIGQIRQSKLLLNLLDIKTIEENQYILTYLQIQR
ncbi:hypothetical protein ABPG74_004238 [Tetrahymena malaccensis]